MPMTMNRTLSLLLLKDNHTSESLLPRFLGIANLLTGLGSSLAHLADLTLTLTNQDRCVKVT